MTYYHNLITQKSWQVLQNFKKEYQFILIGGWAVYLYCQTLKSKDIDLVLAYDQLEKLKQKYPVEKNNRLKKYEVKIDQIDIDIYLPFYSNPGLPAETLTNYQTTASGFTTLVKEILVVLKQHVLIIRYNSVKGRKDLLDLISLFKLADFNWQKYHSVVKKYHLQSQNKQIINIFKTTYSLEEINLNQHQISRLKKKIIPLLQADP